jgi:hypothetical protein
VWRDSLFAQKSPIRAALMSALLDMHVLIFWFTGLGVPLWIIAEIFLRTIAGGPRRHAPVRGPVPIG